MTPNWPTCKHKSIGGDPCIGIRADPHEFCLAHLHRDQRDAVLAELGPDSDVDARGVHIDDTLLAALLAALADDGAKFGHADFTAAQFSDAAGFAGVRFSGDARFEGAQFSSRASFDQARFRGDAVFDGVQFGEDATFQESQFRGHAAFNEAQFNAVAWFRSAQFSTAWFNGAQFRNDALFECAQVDVSASFKDAQFSAAAWFHGAQIQFEVSFERAQFSASAEIGPLVADRLKLDHVIFAQPAVIEAAASALSCSEARFESGMTLRLRYADIVMDRAVFNAPSSVACSDAPFPLPGDDTGLDDIPWSAHQAESTPHSAPSPVVARLMSVREVDVSKLVVTDLDLSECRFASAHNLDKLRLDGRIVFSRTPRGFRVGWAWPPVWRWTRRQVLAEERTWRARPQARKRTGWQDTRPDDPLPILGPERLAVLYRSLRKAREDGKDEPGAADFYYGEMEMRRHASPTPRAERFILTLYWLISGYGLRASRALLVLAGLIAAAAFGFQEAGFPCTGRIYTACPQQSFVGSLLYAAGSVVSLDLKVGGLPAALTTWGQLLRILLRISGPVLLGLAALAVRGRVKR